MSNFYSFQIIAKTGDQAIGNTQAINKIKPEVSINDLGQVAFIGEGFTEQWIGLTIPKDTIFVGNGQPNSLRNISPDIIRSTFLNPQYALTNPSRWFDFNNASTGATSITISSGIQINNSNEVLVRRIERVRGPGVITSVLFVDPSNGQPVGGIPQLPFIDKPYTFIEKWDANTTNSVEPLVQGVGGIVLTTGFGFFQFPLGVYRGDYDIVDRFPSFNNNGGVVYTARNVTSTGTKTYLATSIDRQEYTGDAPSSWMSDNGTFVKYFNGEIAVFDSQLNQLSPIAGSANGFTKVGKNPRISDDGTVVTFYGDLSLLGAIALNLTPGAGIFTWANGKIFRIAGVSNNGYLDPSEIISNDDGDGILEPNQGEKDEGLFASFDLDSRLGVGFNKNIGTIAYTAFDKSGKEGLYTSFGISGLNTFSVDDPKVVIQVGDEIPGFAGKVQDLEIYDPVNAQEQLAFWVKSDSGNEAVIRANAKPTILIEDSWVDVKDGTKVIKFKVKLSEVSDKQVKIDYSTLDSSANSLSLAFDKKDYFSENATLVFEPGETEKEIKIIVFGDLQKPDHEAFEIFARDTAYRNWQVGQDADRPDGKQAYEDLEYRINKVFDHDSTTGFYATGLTSDENFYLVLSNPVNAYVETDRDLLKEVEGDLVGETESNAYTAAQDKVDSLQNSSWSFAKGTIYDSNKAPVLAIRGSVESRDFLSDSNPNGVGFDQFSAHAVEVLKWLQDASKLPDDSLVRSHITGHSLGGALTQWMAAAYPGQLGEVVTFSAPGIATEAANKPIQAESVTHYITSADIVSMAGWKFIPGQYTLFSYPSGWLSVVSFEKHTSPRLIPEIVRSSEQRPSNLSRQDYSSVNKLNDFFFTYLPDPDYFALQKAIASASKLLPGYGSAVGHYLAAALTFRGTVEINRAAIGEIISAVTSIITSIYESVQFVWESANTWSSAAWSSIVETAKQSLNLFELNQTLNTLGSNSLIGYSNQVQDLVLKTILDAALQVVETQLSQFATNSEFNSKLNIAFGSSYNAEIVQSLKQNWVIGDLSDLGSINIVPSANIYGANAGFSLSNQQIYVSKEFLEQNINAPETIASILLEEIGHYVDDRINQIDSPGDEGAIFAALVKGIQLTEVELQALREENDIVFSNSLGSDPNRAENFWEAMADWEAPAWNALSKWTPQAWDSISTWTADTWHTTTQWTADTWNTPFPIISSPTIAEGNSGTSEIKFTINLSLPSTQTIQVDYTTIDNTALAGQDYIFASGTLEFAPGELEKIVTVKIIGDKIQEANETFYLSLTKPANTLLIKDKAIGLIQNDDTKLNTLPIASNDIVTTNEDQAIPIDVLANDSDSDGDSLTFRIITAPSYGIATIDTAGTPNDTSDDIIIYNPNSNFNGSDTLVYQISDGQESVTATVTIDVTPVNDAPILSNPIANQTIASNQPFTSTFAANTFSDIDTNDTLTYTARLANGNTLPSWLTFDASTRTFKGTPTNTDIGTLNLKVTATDSASAIAESRFALTVTGTSANGINGTPNRDTLTGSTSDDIITGFAGADTLKGDRGKDQFVYTHFRDAGDFITDFEPGQDKLVLTQLLKSLNYKGTNAIADGYVRLRQNGAHAIVQIDPDGSRGSGIFRPFLTLQNLAVNHINLTNDIVV